MSAADVYFAVRHDIDHGGFPPFSGEQMSRLRDAADEALAEMEWEVQRAKFQSYNELRQRAEQAEAQLSTLKEVENSLRDELAAMTDRHDKQYDLWLETAEHNIAANRAIGSLVRERRTHRHLLKRCKADLAAMTKERERWEMIARGMAEIYSEPGDCGEENLVNLMEADENRLPLPARVHPMSGMRSRRKGRAGELAACDLLTERGFEIVPLGPGRKQEDILCELDGMKVSVEVKNCKLWNLCEWRRQAKAQAKQRGAKWLLLARIPDCPGQFYAEGSDVRPTVWRSNESRRSDSSTSGVE